MIIENGVKKISDIKQLKNESEWLYQILIKLDNEFLDFLLIEGKKFLEAIESEERIKLHYFEKIISDLIAIIYKIKEDRLGLKTQFS